MEIKVAEGRYLSPRITDVVVSYSIKCLSASAYSLFEALETHEY
jgi:hypothetical protein